MPSLTVEELIDTACARVGSDDFGPDTWREGLEVLVGALNREGNLNELGVAVFTDQIVGNLVNRLEDRAVVRTASRDRRPGDRRATVRSGHAAHGIDRHELPRRVRPLPPFAAHVGGRDAVPSTRAGDRAHRPANRGQPGR